jgi:hypothetical protein
MRNDFTCSSGIRQFIDGCNVIGILQLNFLESIDKGESIFKSVADQTVMGHPFGFC